MGLKLGRHRCRHTGMRPLSLSTLFLLAACGATLASARADDRGRPSVTFYEHADFRGGSFTVYAGDVLENLTRVRFSNGQVMNDRISSFRVEAGAQVSVFQDAGFRGDRDRFQHSVANLGDSAPGWNDAISSLRVERGGRDDGDRGRPDSARVDAMIRRAYRDMLRRDADEGGLRDYRRHILQDNWSEEQLRHSLRESDEYRPIADRIINEAYREVFRRDPDERELRRMREQMIRRGWNGDDVRKAIRRDDAPHDRPRPPRGG